MDSDKREIVLHKTNEMNSFDHYWETQIGPKNKIYTERSWTPEGCERWKGNAQTCIMLAAFSFGKEDIFIVKRKTKGNTKEIPVRAFCCASELSNLFYCSIHGVFAFGNDLAPQSTPKSEAKQREILPYNCRGKNLIDSVTGLLTFFSGQIGIWFIIQNLMVKCLQASYITIATTKGSYQQVTTLPDEQDGIISV